MKDVYLDAIRKFEGFTQQAQWDYAQYTNGFGTKALYPGEVIDKAEAEKRFRAEVDSARAVVDRHLPNADEGTKAALTSLTFNAGDKWARSGLGEALRQGDMDTARTLFLQYNKAGGVELPGLVSRRLAEATWIGGDQTGAANVTSAIAPTAGAQQVASLQSPTSPAQTQLAVEREGGAAMQTLAALAEDRDARSMPAFPLGPEQQFAGRASELLMSLRLQMVLANRPTEPSADRQPDRRQRDVDGIAKV
jgi:lysozyme